MKRPERLLFKGKKGADGRPVAYYPGVPARNLEAADIARLSDEQIKDITAGEAPMYVAPEPKAPPKPKTAPKKRASRPKPAAKPTEAGRQVIVGEATPSDHELVTLPEGSAVVPSEPAE
jgi:hypothetical protein